MATRSATQEDELGERYRAVRALSRALAAPLSDADATIQPMPDASPTKWHLAHSSWFFETFVLRDHAPGHRSFDPRWAFLFNSYYEGEGARIDRATGHAEPALAGRGARLSRAVDAGDGGGAAAAAGEALELVALGLQHEQQHQELILMDLLAAMAENPLRPAVGPPPPPDCRRDPPPAIWCGYPGGIVRDRP
jgi:hypothetical protein